MVVQKKQCLEDPVPESQQAFKFRGANTEENSGNIGGSESEYERELTRLHVLLNERQSILKRLGELKIEIGGVVKWLACHHHCPASNFEEGPLPDSD